MSKTFSNIRWIIFFAFGALMIHLVKYQVEDVRYEVDGLEAQLVAEKEAYSLLQAEWSYLNRPGRLTILGKKYLQMDIPKAQQVVDLSVLDLMDMERDRFAHAER
ncbi:MAG: hypothetical protein MRY32_05845 [Rickettsiales bacterium]|nr:hypothetical protein [Rickettsiales bacterium]